MAAAIFFGREKMVFSAILQQGERLYTDMGVIMHRLCNMAWAEPFRPGICDRVTEPNRKIRYTRSIPNKREEGFSHVSSPYS